MCMTNSHSRTVAIFVHQPMCSIQSVNGIMQSLGKDYQFKIFTKHQIEESFFDDVGLVVFPGGLGDSESWHHLLLKNKKYVDNFVARGGKYLGICMGAYWAGPHYFNVVNNLDVVQYIKQPGADTRRPHAKHQAVTWKNQFCKMFFYDGCAIVGPGDIEVWARYPNGNIAAGIQNNVGLIGTHPESTEHWYASYSWMHGQHHDGKHHEMLKDFVENLIKK